MGKPRVFFALFHSLQATVKEQFAQYKQPIIKMTDFSSYIR